MSSLVIGDLRRVLREIPQAAPTLLFLPSADAELLLGVAELLASQPLGPPIALRVMYDDIGSHASAPTWRSALHVLLSAPNAKRRVHLFAETESFARAIRQTCQRDVAVIPHPSPLQATPPPSLDQPFVLYIPGRPRADKGADLARAIKARLSKELPARWTSQITIRAQFGETSKSGPVHFEALSAHLSAADYAEQWRTCHAALLLNDPSTFALRGSGTVCDAVASQRPFVALEGSSLTEWINGENGITAKADAASISGAILRLMENYSAYQRGLHLAARRLEARLGHGTDVLRSRLLLPNKAS